MKKLISLLMVLLLVLTSAFALAETEAEPTEAPAAAAETTATAEVADTAEVTDTAEAPAQHSLLVDGLQVTVIGLAGVFLVLILFFLTIKMMHKILK